MPVHPACAASTSIASVTGSTIVCDRIAWKYCRYGIRVEAPPRHCVSSNACRREFQSTFASESEVIQWCRDHIAHYKVPKKVVFGPLPTTATGKIQKFLLGETASELK